MSFVARIPLMALAALALALPLAGCGKKGPLDTPPPKGGTQQEGQAKDDAVKDEKAGAPVAR